jgi:hypothetical protein
MPKLRRPIARSRARHSSIRRPCARVNSRPWYACARMCAHVYIYNVPFRYFDKSDNRTGRVLVRDACYSSTRKHESSAESVSATSSSSGSAGRHLVVTGFRKVENLRKRDTRSSCYCIARAYVFITVSIAVNTPNAPKRISVVDGAAIYPRVSGLYFAHAVCFPIGKIVATRTRCTIYSLTTRIWR